LHQKAEELWPYDKLMQLDFGRRHLKVKRESPWLNTLEKFLRHKAKGKKFEPVRFDIQFVNEPAVDMGGPKREYQRLLVADVLTCSGLVLGPSGQSTLRVRRFVVV
jgi:hypothetical protein